MDEISGTVDERGVERDLRLAGIRFPPDDHNGPFCRHSGRFPTFPSPVRCERLPGHDGVHAGETFVVTWTGPAEEVGGNAGRLGD